MLLIRNTEEKIAMKYSENKMRCPTHLCSGQEAVSAAINLTVKKNDYAVGTHRSHGHYLGKGGNLNKMIAEIYGKKTGCSGGYGGSMHLIDQNVNFVGSTAIVGNTIPIGAGLALTSKINKKKQITVIFLGDGSIEEGVFYETVNFCAVKKLPVLFICENNFYSVYSSLKPRQPKDRKIYKMVQAMGIESFYENGNDAIKCFKMLFKKINEIRINPKPIFIEFTTYRWREHCGPNFDNNIGYRTEQEFIKWKKKDPILNLKKFIINNKILNKNELLKIEKKIDTKINNAFDFAEKSPFPEYSDLKNKVYA
tara:strand:+ start:3280 stop:4209 length:930 start_codon:yes stop_codon:yes gene_type:complete